MNPRHEEPENRVARIVVDICIAIHRAIGPGLFESVYEAILVHELEKRGLRVARLVELPVVWDGRAFEKAFRADIIVEDVLLIELKAVADLSPVFHRQVVTYLKLTGKRLGRLINFGAEIMRKGITRVVNGMPKES